LHQAEGKKVNRVLETRTGHPAPDGHDVRRVAGTTDARAPRLAPGASALVNLLLLLFATALALVIVETAAIVLLPSSLVEKWPPSRTEPDQQLGWRMVPNDEHFTYTFPVRVNSYGLRNRELDAKQGGEFRVLVLGDSHVYGQGLSDDEVFTTKLERRLHSLNESQREGSFNVINAGARAYSVNQEIIFLRTSGMQFLPDLVLLCFYVNDLELVDTNEAYRRARSINNGGAYLFDVQRPDGIVARAMWEAVQILRRSRVLMFANDTLNAFRAGNDYEARFLHGEIDDDIRARLIQVTDQFREFKAILSENGIAGLVIIIPSANQLLPQFASDQYQRLVADAARGVGLEVIDLLPAFRARFRDPHALPILAFDGHYDATAHQLIADTLYPVVAATAERIRGRQP